MLEWFDSTATLNLLCERDGMVDMSGLDSGDISRVGSSPAARKIFWSLYWLNFF